MYEIYARVIEFFAMIVMAVGFYYGYRLMKFIPKRCDDWQCLNNDDGDGIAIGLR